jgi:hypothetical protein
VRESLGRAPTLKDFGASKFKPFTAPLGGDLETAWQVYCGAIEAALDSSP